MWTFSIASDAEALLNNSNSGMLLLLLPARDLLLQTSLMFRMCPRLVVQPTVPKHLYML